MKKYQDKKGDGLMNRILFFIAFLLVVFSVAMILIYIKTGGIPDTLCTCVFGVCGGECGVMGWIKTTKDKQRERREALEDRAYQKSNEEDLSG